MIMQLTALIVIDANVAVSGGQDFGSEELDSVWYAGIHGDEASGSFD